MKVVAQDGTLLIDMTTSEPALAREIHAAAAARGVEALDAPVSGGDVGAREATLVIMAGGVSIPCSEPAKDVIAKLEAASSGKQE